MPYQIVQPTQRLLDRRVPINPVHLVQINPIRPQPSQAVFHRRHNIPSRTAPLLAAIVQRGGELRLEHDRFAVVAQNAAAEVVAARADRRHAQTGLAGIADFHGSLA